MLHILACRECILSELTVRKRCPLCRGDLSPEVCVEGVSPVTVAAQDDAGDESMEAANLFACESKLRALLQEVVFHVTQRSPPPKCCMW